MIDDQDRTRTDQAEAALPRMPAFDLEAFLPYRMAVLSGRITRAFAARYGAAAGLSIPEWRVLAHLAQSGAVSVRDIHARVDMDKSKVSRAASRLEEAGLVTKLDHQEDRRLVSLSLTPAGRAVMAQVIPLALDFQAEIEARLGPLLADFEAGIARLDQMGGA